MFHVIRKSCPSWGCGRYPRFPLAYGETRLGPLLLHDFLRLKDPPSFSPPKSNSPWGAILRLNKSRPPPYFFFPTMTTWSVLLPAARPGSRELTFGLSPLFINWFFSSQTHSTLFSGYLDPLTGGRSFWPPFLFRSRKAEGSG